MEDEEADELKSLKQMGADGSVSPTTIPAICAAWLKENGFDGLCDPEMECGCSVLDLMPCSTPGLNTCVPAHKELQDDGDWLMFPGKADSVSDVTSAGTKPTTEEEAWDEVITRPCSRNKAAGRERP